MNTANKKCPNMNHGKINASIRFCPTCGKTLNSATATKNNCDDEKHRSRRKDRSHFCFDCGKDLNKQ